MNKGLKTGLVIVLIVGLMAATVFGAILVTNTQAAKLGHARLKCEAGEHRAYKVVIENDKVVPVSTVAKLCDTLTITNLDDKDRIIAFGPHEQHVTYDGVSERNLGRGQNLTITLVQAGSFRIHDHTDDTVNGTFAVSTEK